MIFYSAATCSLSCICVGVTSTLFFQARDAEGNGLWIGGAETADRIHCTVLVNGGVEAHYPAFTYLSNGLYRSEYTTEYSGIAVVKILLDDAVHVRMSPFEVDIQPSALSPSGCMIRGKYEEVCTDNEMWM